MSPSDEQQIGSSDPMGSNVTPLSKTKELKSQPAVWQELGWSTPNGCHVCRPAINYYLLADWPLDYADDPQSRFVNERNHANIQKDGTYSVVPRMWGGITTPEELRAIAAVGSVVVAVVKMSHFWQFKGLRGNCKFVIDEC